jgi:hypothetical protein
LVSSAFSSSLFKNFPLELFPVFGPVAVLLFGLAYPLEGIVVLSDQVILAAGATRANENIPTPHHRAETTPQGQSTGSSFFASPPGNAVQFGNQCRMHVEIQVGTEAPAGCYVQVLLSTRQEVLQTGRPAKRPKGAGVVLCGKTGRAKRVGKTGRLPRFLATRFRQKSTDRITEGRSN